MTNELEARNMDQTNSGIPCRPFGKAVCLCATCGNEIYEGDTIYVTVDGTTTCDRDCALQAAGIEIKEAR